MTVNGYYRWSMMVDGLDGKWCLTQLTFWYQWIVLAVPGWMIPNPWCASASFRPCWLVTWVSCCAAVHYAWKTAGISYCWAAGNVSPRNIEEITEITIRQLGCNCQTNPVYVYPPYPCPLAEHSRAPIPLPPLRIFELQTCLELRKSWGQR